MLATDNDLTIIKNLVMELDAPLSNDRALPKIYILELDFLDAKNTAALLNSLKVPETVLSKDPGSGNRQDSQGSYVITYYAETNSLLIKATPQVYWFFKGIVDRLDVNKVQVLIKVHFLEFSQDSKFSVGAAGFFGLGNGESMNAITSWRGKEVAALAASEALEGVVSESTRFDQSVGSLSDAFSIGVVTKSGVEVPGIGLVRPAALLKMIQDDSKTAIHSSPLLLATDGMAAQLEVGETLHYEVSIPNQSEQKIGETLNSIEKVDANISLEIKPKINTQNRVRLSVLADLDQVTGFSPEGKPVVAKRKLKQDIELHDGETFVVAGLKKVDLTEKVQKVPYLGDIPFLGVLFSSKNKLVSRKEMGILLTPHVIRSDKDLKRIYDEKIAELGNLYPRKSENSSKN